MRRSAFAALQLAARRNTAVQQQACRHYAILNIVGLGKPPVSKEPVEVCFMDPKLLLDPEERQLLGARNLALPAAPFHLGFADPLLQKLGQGLSGLATCITVPGPLVKELSKGKFKLGNYDGPMNSWSFGASAEIYEYHLAGVHPAKSGYTSIVRRDMLHQLLSGEPPSGLPSWEQFKDRLQQENVRFPSQKHPLLFAGIMIDTQEAAVFTLVREGQVAGVLVLSESAGSAGD